jgi:AIG2-like family
MKEVRKYYFAYGSNIEEKSMHNRCKGTYLVCRAELPNHKFLINSDGYATIIPRSKEKVYGLIWSITEPNEQALDKYEGVSKGLYYKVYKKCTEINGKNQRNGKFYKALLYVSKDGRSGKAHKIYLEKILDSARINRFPKNYIKKLEFLLG